jgi:hypothetical protein
VYENLENDTFVGKFEGQFLEGKMDGLGLYYWPQGDMFMGEYAQVPDCSAIVPQALHAICFRC